MVQVLLKLGHRSSIRFAILMRCLNLIFALFEILMLSKKLNRLCNFFFQKKRFRKAILLYVKITAAFFFLCECSMFLQKLLHLSQRSGFFIFGLLPQLIIGETDVSFNMDQTENLAPIYLPGHKSHTYEEDARCELIEIEKCKNLGYNFTKMPNALGQERQVAAKMDLNTYQPLIQTNCSQQLVFFLCAVYVPMCNERVPKESILPCQSMCRAVEKRCKKTLNSFGFDWPMALTCTRFPVKNGNGVMCMEGDEEDFSRDNLPKDTSTSNHFCKYDYWK